MNQPAIRHKRGDTFHYVEQLPDNVDLSGSVVKSQLRTSHGVLVDELEAKLTSDGVFSLRKQSTSKWPLCDMKLDVEFTLSNGDVISTNTLIVRVEEDVTL